MKKLGIVIALLIGSIVTFWYVAPPRPDAGAGDVSGPAGRTAASTSVSADAGRAAGGDSASGEDVVTNNSGGSADVGDMSEGEDRPATELYKDANEAFEAVKAGATNFNDTVLEQFTLLGPNCQWCDEFYKSVRDVLAAPDTPSDQKSYFAEILAVSGRVDNVERLVESIEKGDAGAADSDKQVYLEALEMTLGKDDIVRYLGTKISTNNQTLRESIVAAISNQGSPVAVETLYKQAVDSGNADGFYSQGTGLGEVVPDPEAFPALKDIVRKKDDYSHLAVKSLMNAGIDGVKSVVELLENSPDPERDRALLKDAPDHVNFDERVQAYLKESAEKSQNPAVVEFSKAVNDSFSRDQLEEDNEAVQSLDAEPAEIEGEDTAIE